ncbi:MAG: hypothetical protein CL878_07185 [Dehalococcoidia bacterium]|nr:hypothetical protein [Dehalococcoidia bacterium]
MPFRYQAQFQAAQRDAHAAGRGLWAACFSQSASFGPQASIRQGNAYNCGDFASQAQAQLVLRADPSDPNHVDGDRDGLACESRPAPKDLTRVPSA